MQRLVVVSLAVLLAGCGSGGGAHSAQGPVAPASGPAAAATPTVASCPAVNRPRFAWPSPVPHDLPQPPGSTYTSTTSQDKLTLVRFSSAHSLRESVLFVVHALPASGFALGRGDAEPAEADAPFVKGEVRGVVKMLAAGPCTTQWLVVVTNAKLPGGGSPLLPTPAKRPGSTPSPLPFG